MLSGTIPSAPPTSRKICREDLFSVVNVLSLSSTFPTVMSFAKSEHRTPNPSGFLSAPAWGSQCAREALEHARHDMSHDQHGSLISLNVLVTLLAPTRQTHPTCHPVPPLQTPAHPHRYRVGLWLHQSRRFSRLHPYCDSISRR